MSSPLKIQKKTDQGTWSAQRGIVKKFDPDTQGALDATRVHMKTIMNRLLEVCQIADANADVNDYVHAFSDWQYQIQGSLDEVAYVFGAAADDCYHTWHERREAIPDNDWWPTSSTRCKRATSTSMSSSGRSWLAQPVPCHRWNGWATPWFPRLCRTYPAEDRRVRWFTIDRYRTPVQVWLWNKKEYADEYDDERGRLEASMVDGVTLYDIGQGGWCWDEVTRTVTWYEYRSSKAMARAYQQAQGEENAPPAPRRVQEDLGGDLRLGGARCGAATQPGKRLSVTAWMTRARAQGCWHN